MSGIIGLKDHLIQGSTCGQFRGPSGGPSGHVTQPDIIHMKAVSDQTLSEQGSVLCAIMNKDTPTHTNKFLPKEEQCFDQDLEQT